MDDKDKYRSEFEKLSSLPGEVQKEYQIPQFS
jgi:hypothetical protein